MPQPAHKPTDKTRGQVEAMSGYGLKQEVIGIVIGISVPTLHKYYRAELDRGDGIAQAKIGKALFELAVDGKDRTSLIFLAKVRLGFKEAQEIVVTDPEGKTPVFKVIIPGLGKGNGRDESA